MQTGLVSFLILSSLSLPFLDSAPQAHVVRLP